jgi:hypothetical protein
MSVTLEEVATVFRAVEPYPEKFTDLLRERGQAFVETMIAEIESFEGEESPWLEAECIV